VFILDTDHLTFLEHGTSVEAGRLKARLKGLKDAVIAVTIVSFEEQTRGWLAYLARARSVALQVEAYAPPEARRYETASGRLLIEIHQAIPRAEEAV
jgi:hypothetical protein